MSYYSIPYVLIASVILNIKLSASTWALKTVHTVCLNKSVNNGGLTLFPVFPRLAEVSASL